jgi:RimJ/RimL family protein N-acetyltransferase
MLACVIRLLRADVGMLDAALAGDDALTERLGVGVVPGWATFREALRPTRDALAQHPPGFAWSTRLFVAGDPPEVVGWGGFKGAPQDGVVEIGYGIGPSRRERGLATAAARALVDEAFAEAGVTAVIAHTLPEPNASTRVLQKAGFAFAGDASEGGERVWRWCRSQQR